MPHNVKTHYRTDPRTGRRVKVTLLEETLLAAWNVKITQHLVDTTGVKATFKPIMTAPLAE